LDPLELSAQYKSLYTKSISSGSRSRHSQSPLLNPVFWFLVNFFEVFEVSHDRDPPAYILTFSVQQIRWMPCKLDSAENLHLLKKYLTQPWIPWNFPPSTNHYIPSPSHQVLDPDILRVLFWTQFFGFWSIFLRCLRPVMTVTLPPISSHFVSGNHFVLCPDRVLDGDSRH